MRELILDLGSGNTCHNSREEVYKLIDAVPQDPRIVLKWQLFTDEKPNISLDRDIFRIAYEYAATKGFKTTASVFDLSSLRFLLTFNIPFIKIANNAALYELIGHVPRNMPVYASFSKFTRPRKCDEKLCCISEYPAPIWRYYDDFGVKELKAGISDHTNSIALALFQNPAILENHFCLEDSEGLDAGAFARTPWQIEKLVNKI